MMALTSDLDTFFTSLGTFHFSTLPTSSTMPTDQHVSAALSLIEQDKSKILGLNVGTHKNVQPGEYIPRAGPTAVTKRSM
jgi:uncharacterized protein YegL